MERFLMIAMVSLVIGCSAESQRDFDVAVNTCQDISLAQTIYSDAYKQMRAAALGNKGITDADSNINTIFGCENIIVDTISDPKTITIDYKFVGCEGMGIQRFGRMKGEFFGNFGQEGSALDITFSNYFYDTYEIDGLLRVIFKEDNENGDQVHTFYVQNGSVNDGTTEMTWTASQTWTVPETSGIQNYNFTGTSNGQNLKGNVFFAEILSENEITDSCLYVSRGSMEIEVLNLSNRLLNYGSGSCDNRATATINGATHSVSIP